MKAFVCGFTLQEIHSSLDKSLFPSIFNSKASKEA